MSCPLTTLAGKLPVHYGGECYWLPAARAATLLGNTERAWLLKPGTARPR